MPLDPPASDRFGLLAEAPRRYFIESETQDAIGRALGLSRTKVNRMLREAQDQGLVEIRVRLHSSQTRDIQGEFAERFGLRLPLVAPVAASAGQQRAAVAAQAGRRLGAITWVAGSGAATEVGEEGNADHIARALARRSAGRPPRSTAPAYVADARGGAAHAQPRSRRRRGPDEGGGPRARQPHGAHGPVRTQGSGMGATSWATTSSPARARPSTGASAGRLTRSPPASPPA